MKNILIPTDFSDCANVASDYAIQFAKTANAEVHFLHLFSTPIDWVKLPKHKEKLYPEIRQSIAHAKTELSKWVKESETNGVKAQQSLTFNTGKEEILRHLKDHIHDFLIMGSNGAKGWQEKLIGSNAQQIIRNASVPVLIIKKSIFSPIKNILFVSDFTDVSRDSFHTLTDFADLIEAHIDLLFVNTPNQFTETLEISRNMNGVITHCNREKACTKNIINATSIKDGIKDFVAEKPMDLIAISTHGKSGLQQILSPSIAEKIANHTQLPLLSIKL